MTTRTFYIESGESILYDTTDIHKAIDFLDTTETLYNDKGYKAYRSLFQLTVVKGEREYTYQIT